MTIRIPGERVSVTNRVDNPIVPDGRKGRLPDNSVEKAMIVPEVLLSANLSAFSLPGQQFVESGRLRLPLPPLTGELLAVKITVHVAPTGASIICDVNKNGTTIFTTQANRPTIAAGTNASAWVVPNVTGFNGVTDYLTIDPDQVGSTIPGGDLVLGVWWKTVTV